MARSREGKRTRRPEVRTRTGCWKCRERRVKCPEQRPICRHCERLGFVCAYDYRLTWQSVVVHEQKSAPGKRRSKVHSPWHRLYQWMFLNTGYDDFHALPAFKPEADELPPRCTSLAAPTSPSASPSVFLPPATEAAFEEADTGTSQDLALQPIRPLSPLPFSDRHLYLWEYFDKCITPQCVLNAHINPYRNILLRVAASSTDGPLFHCILAVAANELHNLGSHTYSTSIWDHRARALNLLRREVELDSTAEAFGLSKRAGQAQILLSTLMLCFFEITQDCSESWMYHSNFVRSYLDNQGLYAHLLDEEQPGIVHFAADWFTYHDILAGTALVTSEVTMVPANHFRQADVVQSLAGCKAVLLSLIDEISRLAAIPYDSPTKLERKTRRDMIERQLHAIAEPALDLEDESAVICETKRLAALIYLYSRIDNAGPQDSLLERPTRRILELMPCISVRTNALLWPLFIVATLGLRPEWDEDRKFVLERLSALQDTRQLANVKKARKVIEDVWKARDISQAEALKGWTILKDRHGTLSLA